MSVGDSIRLLQLGTVVGRDSMAVNMVYHDGLGEMDIENAMVDGVSVRRLDRTGLVHLTIYFCCNIWMEGT